MYKFIGHDNWRDKFPFPHILDELSDYAKSSDKEVIILRGCLFFYETQKTTLGEVQKHFTESAIEKLFHDGFMKFKD